MFDNYFLLPHVIDKTAERYPDNQVFRFEDTAVTYTEAAHQTNQLAHMLIKQGVQRGDRVGIYLHKHVYSGIALHGIMKAGAAYVPLDPSMPISRLEFVLQDCGIRHVISERSKLANLKQVAANVPHLACVIGPNAPQDASFQVISWQEVGKMPTTLPIIPGLMEDDLAYIMYTSGSTGTPKGLMHTHRSGLAYAKASAELYAIQPDDILGNHAPLHFDVSTFDYFAGPIAGATTVIIPEEYKMLPASLTELIQDEKMTIWYSVVTALVEMLYHGALADRDLSSLRWVHYCGEPFLPKHLKAWMELLPNARFSNVYGPAEVNQCTYFNVPPLPNKYEEVYTPIGHVWDVADWLVVDEDDNEVTPGEPGELLICAPTRMQGYWNQPDLTEAGYYRQKPFPNAPYEKIFYRTGDLVQLDEDGEFKFLGRKDRQMKIRGYRVELDEIEAAIASHEAVAETAVYPLPDGTGSKRIEAAVILRDETAVDMAELQKHAGTKLPSYAVPPTFVRYDTFPRTGSGKINRRALQEMSLGQNGVQV